MHRRRGLVVVLALLLLAAAPPARAASSSACRGSGWVGAWGTAPALAASSYADQTVRVVLHPTRGGERLRLRLSNRFGSAPLTFDRVTVARRRSGARLVAGSTAPVRFGGQRAVTLPRGADVVSDSLRLRFGAFADLAVDTYLRGPSGPSTVHPLANEVGSYTAPGDRTGQASGASFGSGSPAWPFLTGVEVRAPRRVRTLVAFGDSITDGFGGAVARRPGERNTRWPDFLARRLARRGAPFAIVNAGISGNRLRLDAATPIFGPNALSRLDSDVLAVPGAREAIVLEGINDLGQDPPASAAEAIAALGQVVQRLRLAGVRVLVGTLTPAGGYGVPTYGRPEADARRLAVNRWIRTSGVPDGVIDFDAALRDPARRSRLRPAYDSGDHLHPNARGYERMARAVPLGLLGGARCP